MDALEDAMGVDAVADENGEVDGGVAIIATLYGVVDDYACMAC